MNIFLIFILLLIFIYEFSKRIKYLENNEFAINNINNINNIKEKFDNQSNNMTYLPANFSQQNIFDINLKDISEDLGIKRTINQVISATDENIPNDFFKPIDINLFKRGSPKWEVKQRPWNL
jgi:hypothetical protein